MDGAGPADRGWLSTPQLGGVPGNIKAEYQGKEGTDPETEKNGSRSYDDKL